MSLKALDVVAEDGRSSRLKTLKYIKTPAISLSTSQYSTDDQCGVGGFHGWHSLCDWQTRTFCALEH